MRLVVISNHRHEWLLPVLRSHNLGQFIDSIYVSDVTGQVKPSLTAYATALGGDIDSCVGYIDDKEANVCAVETLGIRGRVADPRGEWTRTVEDWLKS